MLSCNICWTVYVQSQRVALDTIQAKQVILSTSFTCQRPPIWRSFGDISQQRTWSSLLLWSLWYCGYLPPCLQFQDRVGNTTSFPWDLFLLQGHVWLWHYQIQVTQTKVHPPKINHRIRKWLKLKRTSGIQPPCSVRDIQSWLDTAQGCVQMALEDLQEGWLHKISGQPVAVLGQRQCKNVFPDVRTETPVWFMPFASCPVTGSHWKEPVTTSLLPHTFTIYLCMWITFPPWTISSPFPCSLSQSLLTHSTSKPHFPLSSFCQLCIYRCSSCFLWHPLLNSIPVPGMYRWSSLWVVKIRKKRHYRLDRTMLRGTAWSKALLILLEACFRNINICFTHTRL